jgi:ABC-type transport system involved in cytochrome c biogenesis permease component
VAVAGAGTTAVAVAHRRVIPLVTFVVLPVLIDALLGALGVIAGAVAGIALVAAAGSLIESVITAGWEQQERARLLFEPGPGRLSEVRTFLARD